MSTKTGDVQSAIMNKQEPQNITYAFIDESGAKGYVRDLSQGRDNEIAVMVAILVGYECRESFRTVLSDSYKLFVGATPDGEKPHIAAAFDPKYLQWGVIARQVREVYIDELKRMRVPIIYSARRLRLSRLLFELQENTVRKRPECMNTVIRVPQHPDTERVEGQIFSHLSLKLDAFGKDHARKVIPCIDQTVNAVVKNYIENLDREIGRASCRERV